MQTILIVDDDKDLRFNLSNLLKDEGYNTIGVRDGREALKVVKENSLDLVLLDIKLPDIDGIRILEKMRQVDKNLIVIMLTAYSDVKKAVRAMKLGAFDYFTKPFDDEELVLVIKKALQTQYLSREVENLRKRLGEKGVIEQAMGESPKIKKVLKQVDIISLTNMTVICQGESGTGKEIIANMIHQKSPRKDKPFIAIDCGVIPETLAESELFGYEKGAFTGANERKEGAFEQANGGTLFLDEITNLSNAVQTKFLRVLEGRKLRHLGGSKDIKIDVRIIVATNIGLSRAERTGKFREDLFHRLNEFLIALPPLRERKEDIPVLAKYFLNEANQELNKKIEGFSSQGMKSLLDYDWPGNVRELKNIVKKAVLSESSDFINPASLLLDDYSSRAAGIAFGDAQPEKLGIKQDLGGASLKEITKKATKEIEEEIIKQALLKVGGNKTKTAKILHINRKALYRKLKSLGL